MGAKGFAGFALFETVMYQQDRLSYAAVTDNLPISVAESSFFPLLCVQCRQQVGPARCSYSGTQTDVGLISGVLQRWKGLYRILFSCHDLTHAMI